MIRQVSNDEKRDSLRLHCDVDVHFHTLKPEELNSMADTLLGRVNPTLEPESVVEEIMHSESHEEALRSEMTLVRRLLEKLTMQMDHLTQVVEGRNIQLVRPEFQPLEVVDCSATGVAMRLREAMPIGTYLKLRLDFKTLPKMSLECIGVAVRCGEETDDRGIGAYHEIGVRFTHIHETDRERIVRHLFKIQRNMLRDRRAAC